MSNALADKENVVNHHKTGIYCALIFFFLLEKLKIVPGTVLIVSNHQIYCYVRENGWYIHQLVLLFNLLYYYSTYLFQAP